MPAPVYSDLTLPDQLLASVLAWFDAHRATGLPTAADLPARVSATGAVAELPCIVFGISDLEMYPRMTSSGMGMLYADLLTPWETDDDAGATDEEHREHADLVRATLAGLSASLRPGPLSYIYLQAWELHGKELRPAETHAQSRLLWRFVASLGGEV